MHRSYLSASCIVNFMRRLRTENRVSKRKTSRNLLRMIGRSYLATSEMHQYEIDDTLFNQLREVGSVDCGTS